MEARIICSSQVVLGRYDMGSEVSDVMYESYRKSVNAPALSRNSQVRAH